MATLLSLLLVSSGCRLAARRAERLDGDAKLASLGPRAGIMPLRIETLPANQLDPNTLNVKQEAEPVARSDEKQEVPPAPTRAAQGLIVDKNVFEMVRPRDRSRASAPSLPDDLLATPAAPQQAPPLVVPLAPSIRAAEKQPAQPALAQVAVPPAQLPEPTPKSAAEPLVLALPAIAGSKPLPQAPQSAEQQKLPIALQPPQATPFAVPPPPGKLPEVTAQATVLPVTPPINYLPPAASQPPAPQTVAVVKPAPPTPQPAEPAVLPFVGLPPSKTQITGAPLSFLPGGPKLPATPEPAVAALPPAQQAPAAPAQPSPAQPAQPPVVVQPPVQERQTPPVVQVEPGPSQAPVQRIEPRPLPSPVVQVQAQTPGLPAGSLRALHQLARDRYSTIDAYYVRLRRREVVMGKSQPEEVMLMKFRKEPWSVYFRWLPGPGAGREMLYVKGRFGDKLQVLTAAGDIPFAQGGGRWSFAPDSPMVRSKSRHTIHEAGIGSLIERFGALVEAAEHGDRRLNTLKYLGLVSREKCPEFAADPEVVMQVLQPGAEPTMPRGGLRFWYFDTKQRLPMLIVTKDERGQEVEYYAYDRLVFPDLISDDEFNPDVLWRK